MYICAYLHAYMYKFVYIWAYMYIYMYTCVFVAVCCSVLQCVTECRRVLQGVAVCGAACRYFAISQVYSCCGMNQKYMYMIPIYASMSHATA